MWDANGSPVDNGVELSPQEVKKAIRAITRPAILAHLQRAVVDYTENKISEADLDKAFADAKEVSETLRIGLLAP